MFKHYDLEIWQEARKLVKVIYKMTSAFPPSERFCLVDQIRRAVVSVPSNIAEGSLRETSADFVHFLVIARGSVAEVDTQLTLAEDLGYVCREESIHENLECLTRRITGLMKYVKGCKDERMKGCKDERMKGCKDEGMRRCKDEGMQG